MMLENQIGKDVEAVEIFEGIITDIIPISDEIKMRTRDWLARIKPERPMLTVAGNEAINYRLRELVKKGTKSIDALIMCPQLLKYFDEVLKENPTTAEIRLITVIQNKNYVEAADSYMKTLTNLKVCYIAREQTKIPFAHSNYKHAGCDYFFSRSTEDEIDFLFTPPHEIDKCMPPKDK